MKKILVFVYGTLRRHGRNHFYLDGSTLVSEQAWTYGELFHTDRDYPMLKPSQNLKVYGELYEVTEEQLARIDDLEGYQVGRKNNLYERVIQTIYTDIGEEVAYLYISEHTNDIHIPYGDWKIFQLLKNKPESVYYFAYGSCMDVERFQQAKVDQYFNNVVGVAVLEKYSMKYLFSTHDGGRADIVEDGEKTEGILYKIPFEAIEYLFNREGYHSGWYRATFVDVTVNGKIYEDVLTFHVYDKKCEVAPPEHYAIEILRGSRNRVSEDYYRKLIQQLKNLQVSFDLCDWE